MEKYKRFGDGMVFKISEDNPIKTPYAIYFTKVIHELICKIQASIYQDKNEENLTWLYHILRCFLEYHLHLTPALELNRRGDYLHNIKFGNNLFKTVHPKSIITLVPGEVGISLLHLLKLASRVDLSEKLIWIFNEEKEDFVIECKICTNFYLNDPLYFIPTRCSKFHKVCKNCFKKWNSMKFMNSEGKLALTLLSGYYNKKIVSYLRRYLPFALFEDERHRSCMVCLELTS